MTSVSEEDTDWEWVLSCPFDPPHEHRYPKDWTFGGVNGTDPRADPRYKPDTYSYIDSRIKVIHSTNVPLCDDEAIDRFTTVSEYGPAYNPVYLHVKRASGERVALQVTYDKSTDTVYG